MRIPIRNADWSSVLKSGTMVSLMVLSIALSFHGSFAQSGQKRDEIQSRTCLRTTPVAFDTVLMGAALSQITKITSTVPDSIYIELLANSVDTNFSLLGGSFPIHLDSARDTPIQLIFRPTVPGFHTSILKLQALSPNGCDPDSIVLSGFALSASKDRSFFSLSSSGPHAIGIASATDTATRTFLFRNDSTNTITIDSVKLRNGSGFRIDSILLPISLGPSGNFAVTVHYQATAKQHQDVEELVIVPNEPILTEAYKLFGTQLQSANGVGGPKPSVALKIDIMPNPARDAVTIQANGILSGAIEVVDILGRTITRASITGLWKWNAHTDGGGKAAAGVYIIRVTGRDENGRSMTASKRLVIE